LKKLSKIQDFSDFGHGFWTWSGHATCYHNYDVPTQQETTTAHHNMVC